MSVTHNSTSRRPPPGIIFFSNAHDIHFFNAGKLNSLWLSLSQGSAYEMVISSLTHVDLCL